MNRKILNILLIITSLFGYLEWGGGNQTFLFEAEGEIIAKLFSDPGSVAHPFIVLPLIGQVILLITLLQKIPGKMLTYIGIGCLAMLFLFMFAIGLMSFNMKILSSTIPFLVVAVIAFRHYQKTRTVDKAHV